MKAVLMSIQPKWVEKIANGEKTIEVRKTCPKIETPFKCYIYDTQVNNLSNRYSKGYKVALIGKGKVIGEFICDNIIDFWYDKGFYLPTGKLKTDTCLTNTEFYDYGKDKPLYGWHISDLKIYDKPKELSEFRTPCEVEFGTFECRGCHYYFAGTNYAEPYCRDGERIITRPPQSFFYVEELSIGEEKWKNQ